MATSPQFPSVVKTWFNTENILTANTAYDGTGTQGSTIGTIVTAGASGSYVEKISIRAKGTNVATVIRLFVNDGLGLTATDSSLFREVAAPATTATQTAILAPLDVPLNLKLQAGYKLNYSIGTAVASGFSLVADGGDY